MKILLDLKQKTFKKEKKKILARQYLCFAALIFGIILKITCSSGATLIDVTAGQVSSFSISYQRREERRDEFVSPLRTC